MVNDRGIFGALGGDSDEPIEQSKAKRVKLSKSDMVASLSLNPMGSSRFIDLDLDRLWANASKPTKFVAYHTEFADADPYRRGVAISRTCEAIASIGEVLDDSAVKAIVKENVLSKAKKEFDTIKPYLDTLNGGKATQRSESIRNLGPSITARGGNDVAIAAKKIYDFLKDENSYLRAFTCVLSCNGAAWSAYVADKVARSAIHASGGAITEDDFIKTATARLCASSSQKSSDEASRSRDLLSRT